MLPAMTQAVATHALDLTTHISNVASKTFKLTSPLRPFQMEGIKHDLANRRVIIVAPTGVGKSLAFQIPAAIKHEKSGVSTVIISPLVALVKDQVDALNNMYGLKTFALMGTTLKTKRNEFYNAHSIPSQPSPYAMIYTTPETLVQNEAFRTFLAERPPARFVFDEAHCVVEWGDTFRPKYKKAVDVCKEVYPTIPLTFLTATAPPEMRTEFFSLIASSNPADPEPVIVMPTPNESATTASNTNALSYEVRTKPKETKGIYDPIAQELKNLKPDEAGLVYCLTRQETESVTEELKARGVSCSYFHSDMKEAEKKLRQEAWLKPGRMGDCQTLVCTPAFGMGINHPRVRVVVHASLPLSLSSYVQQTGRAGRDGNGGKCILYYRPGDIYMAKRIIDYHPTDASQVGLDKMVNFCTMVLKRNVDPAALIHSELSHGQIEALAVQPRKRKIVVPPRVEEVEVEPTSPEWNEGDDDISSSDSGDEKQKMARKVERIYQQFAHNGTPKQLIPSRRAIGAALQAKARGELKNESDLASIKGWGDERAKIGYESIIAAK